MSDSQMQPAFVLVLSLLAPMQAQILSGQAQHVSYCQCLPGSGEVCALRLLVKGIADQLVLLCGGMDLQAHLPELQQSVQCL